MNNPPPDSLEMNKAIHMKYIITIATITLLAAPLLAADAEPMHHWVVDDAHFGRQKWTAAAGGQHAKTNTFAKVIGEDLLAVVFDGGETVAEVTDNLPGMKLPVREMTCEAWVMVNEPSPWGGFISAIQDNGDYERGFILGYQNDMFLFGIAGADKQSLTYLSAPPAFKKGEWHHVAGTYDGKVMKLYVDGVEVAKDETQSGDIAYSPTGYVQVGAYRDDNEYYKLNGLLHEVAVYDSVLSIGDIRKHVLAKRGKLPALPEKIEPVRLNVAGTIVEFVGEDTAQITWTTDSPMPTILEYGDDPNNLTRIAKGQKVKEHIIDIPALKNEREYWFRILESTAPRSKSTDLMMFDTSFNYNRPTRPQSASPFADDAQTKQINAIATMLLQKSKVDQGYCLLIGAADEGRMAEAIVRNTQLQVIMIDTDAARVQAARKKLDEAQIYGTFASVMHVDSYDSLPFGPYLFNMIVLNDTLRSGVLPSTAGELHRVLRPSGGVVFFGTAEGGKPLVEEEIEQWTSTTPAGEGATQEIRDGGQFWLYTRAALPGSGEWTHQYGLANNASCSEDERIKGELTVAWWGKPGPRPMADRGNRNPAPLYAGGRLFVQGNRNFWGIDAYNGTILWSFQTPNIRRSNMARDLSNMVATKDYLYIVEGPRCYAVNAQTGERDKVFSVPQLTVDGKPMDWGYLGVVGDQLVATGNDRGANYLGDQGEWFEDMGDGDVGKVASRYAFSMDRYTGKVQWLDDKGVKANATMTIAGDQLFFVEAEESAGARVDNGRFVGKLPDKLTLRAVDLSSGETKWKKEVDFSAYRFMLYLSAGDGKLVAVGSDENKNYHTQVFDQRDGEACWDQVDKDKKGHHSGHLQHPVIIGNQLIMNRMIRNVHDGALIRDNLLERRGCGGMAAGANGVAYRAHFHGFWDLESDTRSEFLGIRGGCWLGQIPAGGMLLAPETSAGCSCTHSIQTSIGYVPKADAKGTGQ